MGELCDRWRLWFFSLIPLLLTSCQAPPTVQVEQRADWLDRASVRGGTVALLPVTMPGGALPAGMERIVVQSLRAQLPGGKLLEPEAAADAAHRGDADAALASALDQFRTRTALDEAALAKVGRAVAKDTGAEYLALVRLSQLSGYFDPSASHTRQATEGLGANATVRIAIIRAADGKTAFVGVSTARGDAASYTAEPYAPVSNSQISRTSETRRQDIYSDAATPAAVVSAAIEAALSKM